MIIELRDIKLRGHHGVLPQEQTVGQEFVVNLKLHLPPYSGQDSLEATVNYAAVTDVVKEQMAIPSKLIEHVAWRIGRRLRQQFGQLLRVEVAVTKLHPPIEGNPGSATAVISLSDE